jgi:pimeloyl-ACP methyl ester carboxylesterase
MGANIAKMYGGIRPKRLEWLVNLEGLGLTDAAHGEAPKRYAKWLDEQRESPKDGVYESKEQLAAVLRLRNPRLTPERAQFVAAAWSRPARPSTGEKPSAVRLRFDPRHRHVNPILYRRGEAQACWALMDAPMLLLTGGLSEHPARHLQDADAQQLRSSFKQLQMVTVPNVGHMMHHEDPEAVAHHIIEFERELGGATS